MLGFIIRNSKSFNNVETIKKLYNTLVRSKLEYASAIWDPYHKNSINSIEIVQNKFLRYLYYKTFGITCAPCTSTSYLRSMFNYISLKNRRILNSQLLLKKILNNETDAPQILKYIFFYVPPVRPRKDALFLPMRSRTLHHMNSPFVKILSKHNELCKQLDLFSTTTKEFSKQLRILLGTWKHYGV